MDKVTIYTDGSCESNDGSGGWAAIVCGEGLRKELSGCTPNTTNNRMELIAAIQALQALPDPCEVEIFTDAKYLSDGYTSLVYWIADGWRICSGDPVKNKDLWMALLKAAKPHTVRITWVRGHCGNPENERTDFLAKQARKSGRYS